MLYLKGYEMHLIKVNKIKTFCKLLFLPLPYPSKFGSVGAKKCTFMLQHCYEGMGDNFKGVIFFPKSLSKIVVYWQDKKFLWSKSAKIIIFRYNVKFLDSSI